MISKEVDVVKYLLEHKGEELNMRSLAKGLKIDYKNIHTMVKRLQKKGIITLEPFGRSYKILLSNTCSPIVFDAEYTRRKETLKDKNMRTLVDYFQRNVKSRFYCMLLFGSHAKGTQTKHSDIDILFIVPDDKEDQMERSIQSVTSLIPLKLDVHIFKEKDFIAMKNSKETTVGSEAIQNNIILHGIEPYYELLS